MLKQLTLVLFSMIAVSSLAQTVAFNVDYSNVAENGGSVLVELKVSGTFTVDAQVTLAPIDPASATSSNFDFAEMVIDIPAGTVENFFVEAIIFDNGTADSEVFFTLGLSNAVNCTIGSKSSHFVFIQDDEISVPQASGALTMNFLTSYLVDASGSAEIVAYDAQSLRLFVLNSTATKVNVLDFSDPSNITEIGSLDMSAFGSGATSVAVYNGLVAASVDGLDYGPGSVVFLDIDGNFISAVQVGVLPDMVTFTHDGLSLLVANEGEPAQEYTVDPEGSISRIDLSNGAASLTQSDVINIDFHAFDAQIDQLKAAGVRIFGLNSSVSQDLEPEYITVSDDNSTAWVTLQENNALAVVDLITNTVAEIVPLGTKDHSLPQNSLDCSDRNGQIFMANWNIKGMFMPDAISHFSIAGVDYLVTANEGDQREYGVIDEDIQVKSNSYVLDPVAFPDAALLKKDQLLGRLAVSPYSGDTDGDGDIDEIHAFGTRSFSIWNGETGALVYDSGNDFEKITAADPVFGALFNASNDNNTFKNRSDNKGPEPEGITTAQIGGKTYAFITLERTGGVMVYDVTNPSQPVFSNYANSRDLESVGGDLGPEGIIYISPGQSPTGIGYLIMANEVSATLSIYSVQNNSACAADLNNSGAVDGTDFLILLANYGCASGCQDADITGDGAVTIDDILAFLAANGSICFGDVSLN